MLSVQPKKLLGINLLNHIAQVSDQMLTCFFFLSFFFLIVLLWLQEALCFCR